MVVVMVTVVVAVVVEVAVAVERSGSDDYLSHLICI